MRKHLLLLLLAVASVTSAGARAQEADAGCRDEHGLPVGLIMDGAIGDLAFATTINGKPMIILSPQLEWIVPQPTGLFVYAHECGHQALGHVLKDASLAREEEADCWAINLIYRNALVDDAGLRIIERDIARFGIGDATHLPGPERAATLSKCLDPANPWAARAGAMHDRAEQFMSSADAVARHAAGMRGEDNGKEKR
jgi:hypothetical protein